VEKGHGIILNGARQRTSAAQSVRHLYLYRTQEFIAPKSQTEKNHNKEAFALLEVKKSQLTLEFQSIGTAHIPSHKFKHNFLDYYHDFVEANKRKGNRHLEGSLSKFRLFVGKKHVSPLDITVSCKSSSAAVVVLVILSA
jgi:hypothetical protein